MASISNSPFSSYLHADILHSQFSALMLLLLMYPMFPIRDSHTIYMHAALILNSLLSCIPCSGNFQFTIFILSTCRQHSLSIRYFHTTYAQATYIINSSFSSYLCAGNRSSQFTILMLPMLRKCLFLTFYSQAI